VSNSGNRGRWEFDQDGNVHYVQENETFTDGTYRYSRDKQGTHSPKKKDEGWHWVLIVLAFAVWWPAGLLLLFGHLAGRWPKMQQLEQLLHRDPSKGKKKTASSATQKQSKEQTGTDHGLGHQKLLRRLGAGMTALFGFAFVMELIDELVYFVSVGYLLEETVPLLALTLIGLTLIGVAGSRKQKGRRFEKYLSMIGDKRQVSIAALAKAMGRPEKKVEKDLEEMLERDYWDSGYVDAARQVLVLGTPLEDMAPPAPEPAPETAQEAEDQATATLRHIRQVNDAIANVELSNKIYRIEELTAKIFRLLEERPEKAGELRSFMNYYLPQTLKILENYAKLEAQGIEGENIAEAKGKIEAMMDKLVDGYETQLDKLFADDVLDISADLKVMERMLEKDGLTTDSGLQL
jgi:hypothetical protein